MVSRQAISELTKSLQSEAITVSVWSPLRQPLFRALWIASLASNVGTWMHEVAAAWLMTSLTSSPVMIALMQTATSLPILLLGLPAGALADVMDRRRTLLFTQTWMLAAAGVLGLIALFDLTSPWLLLAFTFALGAGAAMNAPAWQATAPQTVPRADLPAAVALTGMGLNLARAVGPALGGAVVAVAGAWAVFLLNAASFLTVMVVLYRWRRTAQAGPAPAEEMMTAIRAGIRYARHAPALRAVLIRTSLFVPFASALWTLLPVLARHEMGLGSVEYGILFGSLGTGAVAGALFLPQLRSRLSTDSLVTGATILFAAAIVGVAEVREFEVLCVVLLAGGVGWITLMASFNVATQMAVPSWVRARAMALYLLAFQGGMTVGSVLWGVVAEHAGLAAALWGAAAGLVLSLVTMARYPLKGAEELDLTPSPHWPDPNVVVEPRPQDGPVLVTVEYRIDPRRARDFTFAMRPIQQQRLRDGAFRAGLYADPADPGRYVETFVVDSWAEHLRQHERVTVSDQIAEDRARAFHIGAAPPVVSHYIHAYAAEMANENSAAQQ
jgi:MFS family permease